MATFDVTSVLAEVGPGSAVADGTSQKLRMDKNKGLVVQLAHGKYTEASRRGNLFMAHAIVTAPVIYSTEAGTGGPLLWNGSSTVVANILAVGIGVTVVTTVAAAIGLTGGNGQTAAPTTTTAIDSTTNLLVGGAASACTAYRVGTTVDNKFFLPLAHLHTGALTVDTFGLGWIELDGLLTVPPGSYVSLAASATATTTVMQACLVWEEIPI
ncbi:MAG: hypothetical protein OEV08_00895 [Nitrospira sp.]|nr:hypothetical protein [Nitrospira sp.]